MINEKFVWDSTNVTNLVLKRNSDDIKSILNNKTGVNKLKKENWDEIAASIDSKLTGYKAAKKYSRMLNKYKGELVKCSKMNASPSKWEYFELFNEYALDDVQKDLSALKNKGDKENKIKNQIQNEGKDKFNITVSSDDKKETVQEEFFRNANLYMKFMIENKKEEKSNFVTKDEFNKIYVLLEEIKNKLDK